MTEQEQQLGKDIVKLPSGMDPTLAVGYMAVITSMHAMNRRLRETAGLPVGPTVEFTVDGTEIGR